MWGNDLCGTCDGDNYQRTDCFSVFSSSGGVTISLGCAFRLINCPFGKSDYAICKNKKSVVLKEIVHEKCESTLIRKHNRTIKSHGVALVKAIPLIRFALILAVLCLYQIFVHCLALRNVIAKWNKMSMVEDWNMLCIVNKSIYQ